MAIEKLKINYRMGCSEFEEDEGTNCEDGDSDTDW
jgi:hypothetical protein